VESVNPHKVLTAIGLVLMLIGLIGVAWSIQPASGSTTVTVPAGAGYYCYMKISGFVGGHLSGDFTVTPGGSVSFYVLDPTQYADYMQDLSPSGYMFTTTGSSGTFSADLPTSGTYYIAFHRGSGYEGSAQIVEVNYNVSGIELILLIGGAVLLAAGVVLTVIGLRMKSKAKAMEPAMAKLPATDVTLFQNKPKSP
jgi:hypothetical protein